MNGENTIIFRLVGYNDVEFTVALDIPTPSDKTALEMLITAAEALTDADYTAASRMVFAVALSDAQAVMADGAAKQEAVDTALSSLQTAMNNLEHPIVTVSVDEVSLDKSSESIAVGGTTTTDRHGKPGRRRQPRRELGVQRR